MHRSRLAKLAALSQGVALLSSLTTAACDRSSAGESLQPPMQPATKEQPATATPPDPSSATPNDTPPAKAVPTRHFPIPNAPPRPRLPDASI
jgi:hypothetical protein